MLTEKGNDLPKDTANQQQSKGENQGPCAHSQLLAAPWTSALPRPLCDLETLRETREDRGGGSRAGGRGPSQGPGSETTKCGR